MTDKAIRHLTTAAVLLVAAIAAVISFIHIRHLAVTHGQDDLSAALLPLSIDGLVAVMSGVMLRAARLEKPAPWLTRPMLFLGVGATLAANLAYGASYGMVGALVSGWPAVAFVGCVEVSVAMVRRTRLSVPQTAADQPVAEQPKAALREKSAGEDSRRHAASLDPVTLPPLRPVTLKPARKGTVAEQAKRAGVSERTMYRRLATANGNGKH